MHAKLTPCTKNLLYTFLSGYVQNADNIHVSSTVGLKWTIWDQHTFTQQDKTKTSPGIRFCTSNAKLLFASVCVCVCVCVCVWVRVIDRKRERKRGREKTIKRKCPLNTINTTPHSSCCSMILRVLLALMGIQTKCFGNRSYNNQQAHGMPSWRCKPDKSRFQWNNELT